MESLEGPPQGWHPEEVELNPGGGLPAQGEPVSGPEAKQKPSVRGAAGICDVVGRQRRKK